MPETYLEHIWVDFPRRNIKILDNEGYDEIVQYRWDKEGAEGFWETVSSFKENVPEEMTTYVS